MEPLRIEENYRPLLIAGLSSTYLFDSPMDINSQWQKFNSMKEWIPEKKNDYAYGICIDLDHGKGIRYVSGVEVSSIKNLPGTLSSRELSSFTYAVFAHNGHVSTISNTCDIIWKEWIPESGVGKPENADFFFERYSEEFDPRKGFGGIEIWIPVVNNYKDSKRILA